MELESEFGVHEVVVDVKVRGGVGRRCGRCGGAGEVLVVVSV